VETVKRQRERALKAKRLLKRKLSLKSSTNNTRPLTQEELLEEAKETEKLNIESLKKFQQVSNEAQRLK
jgi:vacuolar protein sorting-associated protein 72